MSAESAPGAAAAAVLVAAALLACATPTRSALPLGSQRDDGIEPIAAQAVAECRVRRGAHGAPPHPFTTDGCSLWPDSVWFECCVVHDMAYWCGGSADDRARADRALADCVSANGSCGMGGVMGLGVRPGGVPWMPAPWRWGYGWDYPAGYESP